MLPPPRPRSTPPKSLESNPAAEKLDARPPEPPQPPGSVDDVESDGGASTAPDREPVTIGSKATEARQFAKVIKVESVLPKLTKDGKLPTLQLVEDGKPKPSDGEKSNPVLVGLLVCFSLLVSGAMLLVAGMDSSDSEKQIVESRARIRDFCEVRIEQEIAPYQLELRESQLAHSRGDVRAEIRNYEKVMARFHAEDRNRFKGITGSPTSDIELEEHVSRLLNAAKRKLKKGR